MPSGERRDKCEEWETSSDQKLTPAEVGGGVALRPRRTRPIGATIDFRANSVLAKLGLGTVEILTTSRR